MPGLYASFTRAGQRWAAREKQRATPLENPALAIFIAPTAPKTGTRGTDLFILGGAEGLHAAGLLDGAGGFDIAIFTSDLFATDGDFVHLRNMEGLWLHGSGAQSLTLGANAAAAFTGGRVTVLAEGAASVMADGSALPATASLLLHAGAGADTLTGGAGADALLGGTGDDLLVGGAGSDLLAGGAGQDTLRGGMGDDILQGGSGDDTLSGGAGRDLLQGGDGADRLDGGVGADLLFGGLGNDRYIVDDAGDRVSEAGGGGVDTVVSSLSFTLGVGIENLTLSGTASLTGTGNGVDNRMLANDAGSLLAGLAGRDTLIGGAGEDVLAGGLGADRLTGGAGADHFRYGSAGEGGDSVTDFLPGSDVIEVSAAGFGGGLAASMDLLATGRFTSNTMGLSDAPAGTGQFILEPDADQLWWDADGEGTAAAVRIALFAAGTSLAAGDLQVIA